MNPSVVVFDLGHVVCDFRPDRRRAALAALAGIPGDEVDRRLFSGSFGDDCDEGRHHLTEALAIASGALEHTCSPEDLRRAWNAAFVPDPDVLATVDAVRRRRPTALFTNNGPFVIAGLDEELATVKARFDRLFFSCELRVRKPDPAAFRAVAAALGVPPAELHLIDDSTGNVEVARAEGWGGTLFTDVVALTAELTARGLM